MGSLSACAFDDTECIDCLPETESDSSELPKHKPKKKRKKNVKKPKKQKKRKKTNNLEGKQITSDSSFSNETGEENGEIECKEQYKFDQNRNYTSAFNTPLPIESVKRSSNDEYYENTKKESKEDNNSWIEDVDSMKFLLTFSPLLGSNNNTVPNISVEAMSSSLETIASDRLLICSPVTNQMPLLNEQAYTARNERSLSYPPNILLPHMAKNEKLPMSTARLRKLYNADSPLEVVRIIRKQYSGDVYEDDISTYIDTSGNSSENCSENSSENEIKKSSANQTTDSDSDLSLSADREEIFQALIKRDSDRVIKERKRAMSAFKLDGSRHNLYHGKSSKEWEDEYLLGTESDMRQAYNLLKQDSENKLKLTSMDSNLFAIESESEDITDVGIDGEEDIGDLPNITTVLQSSRSELFRLKSNKKWSALEMDQESDALQKQLAHLAIMNSKKRVVVDNDVNEELFNSNLNMDDDHNDRTVY